MNSKTVLTIFSFLGFLRTIRKENEQERVVFLWMEKSCSPIPDWLSKILVSVQVLHIVRPSCLGFLKGGHNSDGPPCIRTIPPEDPRHFANLEWHRPSSIANPIKPQSKAITVGVLLPPSTILWTRNTACVSVFCS